MDSDQILDSLTSEEIMDLTVIGEARGEPIEGQVGVAYSIKNRADIEDKSYREICLAPKQFSCWNKNDPNRAYLIELAKILLYNDLNDIHLKQCQYIAKGVREGKIMDNTGGSRNYMAEWLWNSTDRPDWSKKPTNVPKEIGKHIFFNV